MLKFSQRHVLVNSVTIATHLTSRSCAGSLYFKGIIINVKEFSHLVT